MSSSLIGDLPPVDVKGRRGQQQHDQQTNQVVHRGRDLEPRALIDRHDMIAHHHHAAERPLSLSPIPASMRHAHQHHLRSNTGPPELPPPAEYEEDFENDNELDGVVTNHVAPAGDRGTPTSITPVSGPSSPPTFAGLATVAPSSKAAQQQQQKRNRSTSRASGGKGRIQVAVRKRPIEAGAEDCVETYGSTTVRIAATKLRVDLTEYTESHRYDFDFAFSEYNDNSQVYESCARPLLDTVFASSTATIFAYGQTSSGKTHSMLGTDTDPGVYLRAAADIFKRLTKTQRVFVSLYEIYCNSLFDLLNDRQVVVAREDGNKRVNVCGLTWHEVDSERTLMQVVERGTDQRRTGSTSANEFSSRSHAIMALTIRDDAAPKFCGCLTVVDLAGSERAADTAANDRQTRLEGAEINKSLLALKECIRALDEKRKHVPFRGSKLTEVLRDAFYQHSRTVLLANISPAAHNAEHTLNTLRYAFRVKGMTADHLMPSKDRKVENWAPSAIQLHKQQMQAAAAAAVAAENSSESLLDGGRESPGDEIVAARGSGQLQQRRGASNSKGARAAKHQRRPSESPPPPASQQNNIMMLPAISAIEARMNAQMKELRDEVRQMKDTKSKDDQKIAELSAMNMTLLKRMDELVALTVASNNTDNSQQAANRAPVLLPPMDSTTI